MCHLSERDVISYGQETKRYAGFIRPYDTVGRDKIIFYQFKDQHNSAQVVIVYCHETAHNNDIVKATTRKYFSSEKNWTEAIDSDILVPEVLSPTTYNENSKREDFADSVVRYAFNNETFKKNFPNRHKV